MRVVVAMSGGVDSSVVAGLMVEAGHDVIGLAMKTHNLEPKQNRACCTPDDMRDARQVAQRLDIPFYILNYADVFKKTIMQPFAESYRRGETPNPCVICNDKVKFEPLLERAKLLGADVLATGHYARVVDCDDGVRRLARGHYREKDQSYFLYRMREEQLASVCFPLGEMTKTEVRAHAERMGLKMVAQKHESQEICFVGAEGYAKTVEKILGEKPFVSGDIVHQNGDVLGRHEGIHHYTIGQRKGLGIAYKEALYVVDIDAQRHRVVVGSRSGLKAQRALLRDVLWVGGQPEIGEELLIQQRYRQHPKTARLLWRDGEAAEIEFTEDEDRGAPGQACVIYRDDVVLGGGTLDRARRKSLPLVQAGAQ